MDMEMKMVLNVIELAVSCQLNLHNVFVPFNDGLRSRLTDEAAFMCMCVCVAKKAKSWQHLFIRHDLVIKTAARIVQQYATVPGLIMQSQLVFVVLVVAVAVATTPCH